MQDQPHPELTDESRQPSPTALRIIEADRLIAAGRSFRVVVAKCDLDRHVVKVMFRVRRVRIRAAAEKKRRDAAKGPTMRESGKAARLRNKVETMRAKGVMPAEIAERLHLKPQAVRNILRKISVV